ncbi:hypothetical protein GCWU000323_01957 [Leptotrichia hofstadii F0254]|uniref:Uncharacterized protein n=1 Tax=Leptotrichia hofstadii F0254 TaxID=634994 RepID=C9MZI8_9FUSO|nr:hypothetical protein GCWU000323_01957 [Leptotrichia hofstadii F0254]
MKYTFFIKLPLSFLIFCFYNISFISKLTDISVFKYIFSFFLKNASQTFPFSR